MWQLNEPKPVKLIVGILAANEASLDAALVTTGSEFGPFDLISDVWPFDQTDYYAEQTGPHILRRFVSVRELIDPGRLAEVKHAGNALEQRLAERLNAEWPRPVNLDPGYVEPSKLVLATTKNYAHRIYIGDRMYAEVTLVFDKGTWRALPYTYPDYRQSCYLEFFTKVRDRLLEQLRAR